MRTFNQSVGGLFSPDYQEAVELGQAGDLFSHLWIPIHQHRHRRHRRADPHYARSIC
ncbi:MAG: hypothetical protein R2911_44470 [Caldilineaceae bacterium]